MPEGDRKSKLDIPALCAVATILIGVGIWVGTIEFRIAIPRKVKPVPVGTVLAWDQLVRHADGRPTGEKRSIPEGWIICDGMNGTPDLIGRFLRGSLTSGETGGKLQTSTGYRDGGTDLNGHKHELPLTNRDNVGHAAVGAPFGEGSQSASRDTTPYLQGNGVKTNDKWKLTNTPYECNLNNHTHSIDILPEFYSVIYIMRVK